MHLFRPHKKPQNISERLQERRTFIENILLPCLLFSTLTGIFTGALVFSFNLISTEVVHYSSEIYHFVRENPIYAPLLFLGVIVLGLLAGLMLKWFPNVRGGSLPVAVAQNLQLRVQTSPKIINVAVRRLQHSALLGHCPLPQMV